MTTTLQPRATKATPTRGVGMGSLRRTALVAGTLYLITFVTSIPAAGIFYGPVLKDPNYIVGPGPDTGVLIGGFLEMILALACLGTAVALYPVVKRQNEGVALGFVGTRVLEAAIIVTGIVTLLSVVTLRQAGAEADALVAGHALVAAHHWTLLLGPGFIAGVNALLLGSLMYRSGLVPRIIPLVGLIGAPLLLASYRHVVRPLGTVLPRGPGPRPPGRAVGVVAGRLAGRQGLQPLTHHSWNDHNQHPARLPRRRRLTLQTHGRAPRGLGRGLAHGDIRTLYGSLLYKVRQALAHSDRKKNLHDI